MASCIMMLLFLPLFFLFILAKFGNYRSKHLLPLPPGPRGLPIIRNLHHLDTSNLSDYLWHLSKHYGPLMSLHLGFVQTLVVSSAKMAKEVLKSNDLVFCSRPILTGQQKISYNNKDIGFSPYGDHWREMRKICTLHLFSSKRVLSFCPVREEEVLLMINKIKFQISTSPSQKMVNLSETLMSLTTNIIFRVAFGMRDQYSEKEQETRRLHKLLLEFQAIFAKLYYRDYFPLMGWLDKFNGSIGRMEKSFKEMDVLFQGLIEEHLNSERPNKGQYDIIDILLQLKKDGSSSSMDLSYDHIKAVLMDIFVVGIETSASTVVWAMTLLIKNPKYLIKLQKEVRGVIGDDKNKLLVKEEDLPKLNYLKAVVKETLRLYPVVPLLLPRETRDRCVLDGYEIPKKTLVYVNVWAIGRDPDCWENPEDFNPDRFVGSSVDYKGLDFELIPFGSGRRGCPAISMGAATVELALSNLVYSFDWELGDGLKEDGIDTSVTLGLVLHKKNPLCLVPRLYTYGD